MATKKKTAEDTAEPVSDLVQMASVKADGTVDQNPGFAFHDPEAGQAVLDAQIRDTQDPDRDVVRAEAAEALAALKKGKG